MSSNASSQPMEYGLPRFLKLPLPPTPFLVRLGQPGLKISKIDLGCMSYGNPEYMGNWVLGEEEASKQIKAAYDAGINAFDTATTYSSGVSEEILGRAIKQHRLPRDEIVIMTKVYFPLNRNPTVPLADDLEGYVNQWGLSRKHIFDSVKHSLRRLQLEYIDLLQCKFIPTFSPFPDPSQFYSLGHRFDSDTPIEETVSAFDSPYIYPTAMDRYKLCTTWSRPVMFVHVMQNYAITNKLTPFISMQNHHNLLYREEEREMFPTLRHFGVGAIPWSPLARGALTRPLETQGQTKRGESDIMPPSVYTQSEASQTIVKRVEEVAKKRGISMAQVSVAWSLSREGISAPIVGTTSLANLADAIAGTHITLTEEEITYLQEPYQPRAILGIGK
ncbi:aryl-alcohol dehydrogenase [Mycena polygramma]|nr:aryl-alcohol dehydrogenase [Mycena polygramma]